MKTLFKRLFLLTLTISSLSCSHDDDPAPVVPTPPVYEEQNPLEGYLAATGFDHVTLGSTLVSAEFGISFKPLVNGKITAIVAKFPATNPHMRITFWDKSGGGSIIRTNYINVSTADEEITTVITPLNLVANNEYMITFNSNNWYAHRRSPMSSATYPITIGDIKITAYGIHDGPDQIIPNSFSDLVYKGDVGFKFLQTE